MNTNYDFAALVAQIITVINWLVALLGSVALAIFLYGAVRLLYLEGESKERTKLKELLKWGMIALFVMVSVFGILQIVKDVFLITT